MKFLYKIHAGYDGFTPIRIPSRTINGQVLELGWKRYLDAVEDDDEVWVYFHGRPSFKPGVYVKGIVAKIDTDQEVVHLLIQDYSTTKPLTDPATSRRVGEIVSIRYRQVFLVPDEWKTVANCTLSASADSCASRRCRDCATWKSLPQVDPEILIRPWRLGQRRVAAFVPAFWVIPSRSFLYQDGRNIKAGISRTSQVFYRFKVGDKRVSYPLALGIARQIKKAGYAGFDCIVPIPLSPDKAERGELHRTRALSDELGRLMGAPVVELLSLEHPISKRALKRSIGAGPEVFENAYSAELRVDARAKAYGRVLIVDDVCTEGSTLRCVADAISEVNPNAQVFAATAGQMAMRRVVSDDDSFFVI